MLWLVVGLVLFLGVHSVSVFANGWRDRQLALRGEPLWKGTYSLLSLVGFGVMLWGYGLARQSPVVLYNPPLGLRHVAIAAMLPVFPLLFAAYLPGRIRSATKHPMLVAVKLWAVAHLLANGTLADVVLFGSLLAWAVAVRVSYKRRPARAIRTAPPGRRNDVIAIAAGLALYVAFLFGGHRWLVGVPLLG